jgi:hypothetical protein
MPFATNVFINCPFDPDYRQLQKAIIFTVLYLGFDPQISINRSSSDQRIREIMRLISISKYSIHDISRSEPLKSGDAPRFNMPYEMGIDIGCATYGNDEQKEKRCLILEKVKNRYDIVISDISGQDIKEHNNSPQKIIAKVLEWFVANDDLNLDPIPSASSLWRKFQECSGKIEVALHAANYTTKDIREISIPQYIKAMKSAITD